MQLDWLSELLNAYSDNATRLEMERLNLAGIDRNHTRGHAVIFLTQLGAACPLQNRPCDWSIFVLMMTDAECITNYHCRNVFFVYRSSWLRSKCTYTVEYHVT